MSKLQELLEKLAAEFIDRDHEVMKMADDLNDPEIMAAISQCMVNASNAFRSAADQLKRYYRTQKRSK